MKVLGAQYPKERFNERINKLVKNTSISLMARNVNNEIIGVVPVYLGLLIFLTGIDYGFGFVGQYIGQMFFDSSRPEGFKWLLLVVGFAFDSGGVTGGTLTSAFLTPLTLSIAQMVAESSGEKLLILTNGFGIIYNIRIKLNAKKTADELASLNEFVFGSSKESDVLTNGSN